MSDWADEFDGVGCTTKTWLWLNAFEDGPDADMVESPPGCLWDFIARGGRIGRDAALWLGESYGDTQRWMRQAYKDRDKHRARADELEHELSKARLAAAAPAAADELRRISADLRKLVHRLSHEGGDS